IMSFNVKTIEIHLVIILFIFIKKLNIMFVFLGVGYVLQLKGVLADCPRDTTVAILVGNQFSVWDHLWARLSRFDIILTTRENIIGDLARYQPRQRRNNVFRWWGG